MARDYASEAQSLAERAKTSAVAAAQLRNLQSYASKNNINLGGGSSSSSNSYSSSGSYSPSRSYNSTSSYSGYTGGSSSNYTGSPRRPSASYVAPANQTWQDRLVQYRTDHDAAEREIRRAQDVYTRKKAAGDMQGAMAAHTWANQIRDAMGTSSQYNRQTGAYIGNRSNKSYSQPNESLYGRNRDIPNYSITPKADNRAPHNPIKTNKQQWEINLETYANNPAAGYKELLRTQQKWQEYTNAGDTAKAEAAHRWANQVRDAMGISNQYDRTTGAPIGQQVFDYAKQGGTSSYNTIKSANPNMNMQGQEEPVLDPDQQAIIDEFNRREEELRKQEEYYARLREEDEEEIRAYQQRLREEEARQRALQAGFNNVGTPQGNNAGNNGQGQNQQVPFETMWQDFMKWANPYLENIKKPLNKDITYGEYADEVTKQLAPLYEDSAKRAELEKQQNIKDLAASLSGRGVYNSNINEEKAAEIMNKYANIAAMRDANMQNQIAGLAQPAYRQALDQQYKDKTNYNQMMINLALQMMNGMIDYTKFITNDAYRKQVLGQQIFENNLQRFGYLPG